MRVRVITAHIKEGKYNEQYQTFKHFIPWDGLKSIGPKSVLYKDKH